MSITWEVVGPPSVLVVRAGAKLSAADVVDFQKETAKMPEVHGLDELFDLSACEAFYGDVASVSAVAETADVVRSVRKPGRLAILAPTDLAYGLARMYQGVAQGVTPPREVSVFRTKEEALTFLELPEDFSGF